MINAVATRADAKEIAIAMRKELPRLAEQERVRLLSEGFNPKGRLEWTLAVWQFFSNLAASKNWKLHPVTKPKRGKGAGEFLVDFAVWDEGRGIRVACESDWGPLKDVQWAFDKLHAVKADVKILLFEASHKSGGIPERFRKMLESSLRASHHHSPGREFYIFAQYQREDARMFLWEPPTSGPFITEDIDFELLS